MEEKTKQLKCQDFGKNFIAHYFKESSPVCECGIQLRNSKNEAVYITDVTSSNKLPNKEECKHEWKFHSNPRNSGYEYCIVCGDCRKTGGLSPSDKTWEETSKTFAENSFFLRENPVYKKFFEDTTWHPNETLYDIFTQIKSYSPDGEIGTLVDFGFKELKRLEDYLKQELTSATIKAKEEEFRDGELNGRTQVINLTLGYLIKNGGDQERYAEYISEEVEKLDNLEEPKS